METKQITYEEYRKEFCALILTHGRPDKVYTVKSLEDSGYTGDYYIVIDNEDKTAAEYKRIYKDKVIVFDKKAIAKTFDNADNFNDRRAIVYARNASFEIARKLGYKYFIQLDDDYDNFCYKFDDELNFKTKKILNLDKMFYSLLTFYLSIPAKSIAIAQNGDFIGGKDNDIARKKYLKRKAMNTFICSVDRPFQFVGRINEDVNTYTRLGSTGDLFFTVPLVAINQKQTQSNAGGMTDLYIDSGTYIKSFYTVIFMPSSVKIREMGTTNRRLHHSISWNNTVPKIVERKT